MKYSGEDIGFLSVTIPQPSRFRLFEQGDLCVPRRSKSSKALRCPFNFTTFQGDLALKSFLDKLTLPKHITIKISSIGHVLAKLLRPKLFDKFSTPNSNMEKHACGKVALS